MLPLSVFLPLWPPQVYVYVVSISSMALCLLVLYASADCMWKREKELIKLKEMIEQPALPV